MARLAVSAAGEVALGACADCAHRAGQPPTGPDDFCPAADGVELLRRRGMHEDNLWLDFGALTALMVVARLLGWAAILLRTRFSK